MGKTKIKKIEAENTESTVAGGDAEEGSRRLARNNSEDGRRDTEAAGPRAGERKEKKSKATQKKGITKARGKKYQAAREQIEINKLYSLNEAVGMAQKTSYSQFGGSIEAHLNTHTKGIRGLVTMPFQAGRQLTILAFGKDAESSGADIVGTEETVAGIEKGKINFDSLVTTPEWMPKLTKLARILGPKGLMPNPKNGTITTNLAKTVADLKGGKTEYKTEANGQVVHLVVGKVNQQPGEIAANIKALYNIIGRSKIKKLTLSPSMGPGVKVDLRSI